MLVIENGNLIDTKKAEKEAKKLAKQEAKKEAEKLKRVEAEKNQKEVSEITINISWYKSRTWGNCPSCEAMVKYKDGTFDYSPTYKATGCGYDKESTVIASVFNEYLKYKLYYPANKVKERYADIRENGFPYGVYVRSDWKHFDGGIGTSCYYAIAESIGGKFEQISSGKTFDVYKYTDNN